jgi:hypothetical protein
VGGLNGMQDRPGASGRPRGAASARSRRSSPPRPPAIRPPPARALRPAGDEGLPRDLCDPDGRTSDRDARGGRSGTGRIGGTRLCNDVRQRDATGRSARLLERVLWCHHDENSCEAAIPACTEFSILLRWWRPLRRPVNSQRRPKMTEAHCSGLRPRRRFSNATPTTHRTRAWSVGRPSGSGRWTTRRVTAR